MSDDKDTARLRALVERPERCQFWGSNYVITPRLIARKFGAGKKLLCVTPLATRPNYFVVRVDSRIGYPGDPWPTGSQVSFIEDVMCAAEEEYGCHGDEEEVDEDGDETRDFPVVDWGIGCSWSEPFPAREWKPAPPLVLWFQRDASFNRTGKASGRCPTRWHLPSKADSGLALCRSRGPRRIIIADKHGEALPPKSARCSMCSRAAWRVWRIP